MPGLGLGGTIQLRNFGTAQFGLQCFDVKAQLVFAVPPVANKALLHATGCGKCDVDVRQAGVHTRRRTYPVLHIHGLGGWLKGPPCDEVCFALSVLCR